ncbi:RTC5 [Candida oxycetoniae]|uniref:RTC5 n=1 Tax=Candida oxycetoniae TaxID=497107 RepID=A0AAI9STQ7_9ASCO|nr:RTC5 [Candida oxycetoniae]KAI3402681.2 RTC5 [Candida oxycetoniae]
MGQSASGNESNSLQVRLSKKQIADLFYTRSVLLLKPTEIAFIKSICNKTGEEQNNELVTIDDVCEFFFHGAKFEQGGSNGSGSKETFRQAVVTLMRAMKLIGQFPFLKANEDNEFLDVLNLRELVISIIFLSGRYKKIWKGGYDFVKLWYIALSWKASPISSQTQDDEQQFVVDLIQPFEADDDIELKSRKVNWEAFEVVRTYNGVVVQDLKLNVKNLQGIVTLLLIEESVLKQKHEIAHEQFLQYLAMWKEYNTYSLCLLRYFDISLHATKKSQEEGEDGNEEEGEEGKEQHVITYDDFSTWISRLMSGFFETNLQTIIDRICSNSSTGNKNEKESAHPKFSNSNMVTIPFLAYLSCILRGSTSSLKVTSQNIVKLYAGSESGFSIRSLETKIFKWQAPTLFVVSGRRIKQKTERTNRRYQQFNVSFPRYFLKSESALKPWQSENDRITYCVVVNQPWQHSNKKNFGDEKSLIVSVQPRADYFKSVHSNILKGQSIYFNTLGMGIGFGNSQPVNKTNNQRYYPGNVSLTIEANLEFAVFRHLGNSHTNATNYFQKSVQSKLEMENYEDRFAITDLEVWGIGSKKELDEQQRQWKWEQEQAEARQSVNLRSMGEERAFMEMVGLVGNHGSGGSI